MSDESPKTPPLRDGDPPREVQQLIAEWRRLVVVNREQLPHVVQTHGMRAAEQWNVIYRDRADIYERCANDLSALLTAAGRDQKVQDLESRVDEGQPQASAPTGSTASSNEVAPTCPTPATDPTCEHGTAWDVHCCGCHSGFLFDSRKCVCF
jgi:hypothetical protein